MGEGHKNDMANNRTCTCTSLWTQNSHAKCGSVLWTIARFFREIHRFNSRRRYPIQRNTLFTILFLATTRSLQNYSKFFYTARFGFYTLSRTGTDRGAEDLITHLSARSELQGLRPQWDPLGPWRTKKILLLGPSTFFTITFLLGKNDRVPIR